MASAVLFSPLRQRLGGWRWGPATLGTERGASSSWARDVEHVLGLLGDGCVSFRGQLLGKAFMGLSLTGPPAGISILSSVKQEEDSSDGESSTCPPRDILPSLGPGE